MSMAKLNIRNRNKDAIGKDGKPKSPNWEYRFEAAKIDGKRKSISKAGFRTKKEAEIAGAKALAEYNNAGLKFEPSEVSVSDYLDYWLNNYCKINIADSTMSAYRNIINTHLKPRIGFYKMKAVNTLILQEAVNDIYLNRFFSKSFMKNILKVLKGSFHYAHKTAKIIKENPAEELILPVMRPESEPDEIIVLTKNDINTILQRFEKNKKVYYAFLTAYYTGMRIGEVLGLTWDCIDFEKKKITVNKSAKKIETEGTDESGKPKHGMKRKAAEKWYLGACKNKSSYRTIDVGDTLLNALKQYKEWQEENAEAYGALYARTYVKDVISPANRNVRQIIQMPEMDFEIPLERIYPVFIRENGEFHGDNSIKYASKVINYELLIKFNFHALRHTHATMLIEAGVPIKAVSERLGHTNTRTTIETYVHVTEGMRTDAVDKFEQFGSLDADSTFISFNDLKRKADSDAKAK